MEWRQPEPAAQPTQQAWALEPVQQQAAWPQAWERAQPDPAGSRQSPREHWRTQAGSTA